MFHRFKSVHEVVNYINHCVVNTVKFRVTPPPATEQTVSVIIAFYEAEQCTLASIISGRPPLDVQKWIDDLYVEIDRGLLFRRADYIHDNGSPSQMLYDAIALYYEHKYDIKDKDEDLLDILVDPTE